MKSHEKITIFFVLSIFSLLWIASCGANKVLSATFDESATVVRKWGEACIAGNVTKANKYLSYTVQKQLDVCNYLANHPNSNSLKVLEIEDQGSLINSGELIMIIEDSSKGKRALFVVQLSNSERGPVILDARCNDFSCSENMWYTPITYYQRPDAISRAKVWVDNQVPYNQNAVRDGYRTDCSGFISYAWQLESNGKPISPDTVALGNTYAFDIYFSDLKPGDIVNNKRGGNNGHVVLFVEWLNSNQTRFLAYEENGGYGKAVQTELNLTEYNNKYTIAEYDAIAPGQYYAQRSNLFS